MAQDELYPIFAKNKGMFLNTNVLARMTGLSPRIITNNCRKMAKHHLIKEYDVRILFKGQDKMKRSKIFGMV